MSKHHASGVALAILFFFSGFAQAKGDPPFEDRVSALVGIWLSARESGRAPWVLRVSNVLRGDAKSVELVGYFGPAGGPWSEPKGLVARPGSGNSTQVEFEPASGGKATLSTTSEGTLVGTLVDSNSASRALRFERSSLASIHHWIAENPDPRARATRDSKIELVYISARDCDWCTGWEHEYLDETKGKFKGTAEWKAISFIENKRGNLRGRLKPGDLPASMNEPFVALEKSGSMVFGTTPSYVLLVNGVIRAYGSGTGNFDSLIYPALKAALREKAAAGGT